jgi:3-deoxy-D-manno-octulosonic acid kinase
MDLPPGFERIDEGDVMIAVREPDARFVRSAIASSHTLAHHASKIPGAVALQGRGTAYVLRSDRGRWVVRHYMRGGAVASILGDRYVRTASPRPIAELIISEAARARGIATPAVVAAAVYYDGIWYRGDIATELIENARDLAALTFGEHRWEDDERTAAWRAAGAMLRMSFESGLVHPDLNLKNILVQKTDAGVNAFVIDLDRAHLRRGSTSRADRDDMLRRFDRSRRKIENAFRSAAGDAEQAAFRQGLGM